MNIQIHITCNNNSWQKKPWIWRRVERPIMERLKGGKGREKYCNSNTISKITMKEIMRQSQQWILAHSEKLGYTEIFYLFIFLEGVADRVLLCGPGCPGASHAHSADHTFRDLPASASGVLGLRECAIHACLGMFCINYAMVFNKFCKCIIALKH